MAGVESSRRARLVALFAAALAARMKQEREGKAA